MMSRRNMLRAPALGGLFAALAPAAPAAAAAAAPGAQAAERDVASAMHDVAKAVRDVRDEIQRQSTFWELAQVRDPIKTFTRTNGKYPDFLEVGYDVWQQVYDWHIRNTLPPTVGRSAEGRYTILLMATTLVMRVDTQPSYVGIPYDKG